MIILLMKLKLQNQMPSFNSFAKWSERHKYRESGEKLQNSISLNISPPCKKQGSSPSIMTLHLTQFKHQYNRYPFFSKKKQLCSSLKDKKNMCCGKENDMRLFTWFYMQGKSLKRNNSLNYLINAVKARPWDTQ